MFEQLISMLMTFILLILSIFGGTGDISKNEDGDIDTGDSVVAEYSYTIYDNYIEFKNVSYGDAGERNLLDLYIPKTNSKCTMGLVLYIHGGAWVGGSKEDYTKAAKEYAVAHGYACASISYRYLSEDVNMYDILDDISASLVAIKSAASQVAVTLDEMVLTGGSAGAHLSLLYAYSRADEAVIKPVGVVSYCAPTDLTDPNYWTDYNSNISNDDVAMLLSWATGLDITEQNYKEYTEEILAVSPIAYVDTAVPTAFGHGEVDQMVPYSNAMTLKTALEERNVVHAFVSYPNSGHDLGSDPESSAYMNAWMDYATSEYLTSAFTTAA